MVEVTAGIIEKDGQVLIARRKAGKHLEGFWEFPGGKIEPGETPQECLKRELQEEFSINTVILDFVGESIYHYPNKTIKLLAFIVKLLDGRFYLKDHDKIEWVEPHDLRNFKIAPADIPLITAYEKQRLN